eukprot:CAMPEP_0116124450 /NCGR_PEP_ID=MMETSP0329-20121206/5286_1 /TAXON_ID=697910 /ORGANISM="Pseudo-nitzschia arenysensis, Strain B593" /LENGTH=572 /DNA_ID=CAMNT_0003618429 /DNA_START=128 /DNA_END=1846 /DNA_ORIENTATION=-
MGRYTDESLMSTASTLIDSCSASVNEAFDDENDQEGKESFVCRGRITEDTTTNSQLASPTTTAITLEITESATTRSERTTASKLEVLRAKNRRLREEGSQKIQKSRDSLRKSRTVGMDVSVDESLPPVANPPPYPPPSVHNQAKAARLEQEQAGPSGGFKHNPNAEFSDFLRRSNSVIDRLSAEMAMAGSIINQSVDGDSSFNDTVASKTNDFATNLCVGNYYTKIGQDEKSIQNDENSIHNISVGEDWDQTTISASLAGTRSSSMRQRSIKVPSVRPMSQSGLPPPEVVVKRVTPREPSNATTKEVDASFSGDTTMSYPPRSTVDRHLRQRPPSIYSSQRDSASMYNTNQKVEKLSMENDCLKRQLDLLESRHRDSQIKLMEQLQLKRDELSEEGEPGTITSLSVKSSITKKYALNRKKKKWSDRRRLAVLLLFAPLLISTIIWLYQSARNRPTNGSSINSERIDLSSMMRDGVLGNSGFGETVDTILSDESGESNNEETIEMDDINESSLVVHDPLPEYEDFEDDGESRKKVPRFERIFSRLKFSHKNDAVGVWHENHRKIATEKRHAEL